jgi:single-strand selective monofunctional uracil DNA glycosylase
MSDSPIAAKLVRASRTLAAAVDELSFAAPVAHVYDPLDYARAPHEAYLRRWATTTKRVVFLGMNPGPFGMMQTGVPFGEIAAVRDWLGIEAKVERPADEHPKRRIEGFACSRSEVSGRRIWGLFAARFGSAERFFADHFVVNYCPLVFLEESGRNRTPDKLPRAEAEPLYAACNAHLRRVIDTLEPEWLVGVGGFAEQRAREAIGDGTVRIGRVLHPSPASPAANRDWAGEATRQLTQQGIW